MASHLYSFGAAQSAPAAAAPTPGLSTVYTPRSLAESYHSDPALRYVSGSDPSSMYLAGTEGLGAYSDAARATSYMMSSWPAPDAEPGPPGFKRASEGWGTITLLPLSVWSWKVWILNWIWQRTNSHECLGVFYACWKLLLPVILSLKFSYFLL